MATNSVHVEILQHGKVLKQIDHQGRSFIVAPPSGSYQIRLSNKYGRNTPDKTGRLLVVVSVDGLNIIDGTPASYDGPGYVIMPHQTILIPGWHRSNKEVAEFDFQPEGSGYSAQVGKGTKNTGVIGIAVFEERHVPVVRQPVPLVHSDPFNSDSYTLASEFGIPICTRPDVRRSLHSWASTEVETSSVFPASRGGAAPAACEPIEDFRNPVPAAAAHGSRSYSYTPESSGGRKTIIRSHTEISESTSPLPLIEPTSDISSRTKGAPESHFLNMDLEREISAPNHNLSTGYGARRTMHTEETTFKRYSTTPHEVIQVYYALRAKLIEWGVPVPSLIPDLNAFPSSPKGVPAPPGWKG